MIRKEVVRKFPVRRISPFDGMAVTADVWAEAHDYHRLSQQVHGLFGHGPGILTGLEVIASDPPDSSVYILPGIAVDELGQTIVLHEPVAYDLGHAYGFLHLLIAYDESLPQADGRAPASVRYIHTQFSIEARTTLPDTPYVELARIWRQARDVPVCDAANPVLPSLNEIDLRFRRVVGARQIPLVSIGVGYVGGGNDTRHGQGMRYLARALRQSGQYLAWVDEHVALDDHLSRYTLLYLVGRERFQLTQDELKALYAYLQQGGTVLLEGCRYGTDDGHSEADVSFGDLLASLGQNVASVPADHPLLVEPSLFAAPPPGFETAGQLQVGDGVLWSTFDYGCMWRGARRNQVATREEIRAAHEWGGNLVAYALARQQRTAGNQP